MSPSAYVGRFAPSPTGPLHRGSLVAAMASLLDARAHHGRWLVRIEDVDETRTVPGAVEQILHTLVQLGMQHDGEIVVQSQRGALYQAASERLTDFTFDCACTRKELADAHAIPGPDGSLIYPGTCRTGMPPGRPPRAIRLRVPEATDPCGQIHFRDRWQGSQTERLADCCGDFVLKRADGFWAYQLAVVVDDAAQEVTDVVRGGDLLASTARQIYLQRLLGFVTPRYLHVPVVCNAEGEKLSKQTGAAALDAHAPLAELHQAAAFLGLQIAPVTSVAAFWRAAIPAWAALPQAARGG